MHKSTASSYWPDNRDSQSRLSVSKDFMFNFFFYELVYNNIRLSNDRLIGELERDPASVCKSPPLFKS